LRAIIVATRPTSSFGKILVAVAPRDDSRV